MRLIARWTTLLAAALVLASASGCSALFPFDGNPEDRRDAALADCGNGTCETDEGEDCSNCPQDCWSGGVSPDCSNGKVEPGEACDDRNTNDEDGCDGSCQFEDVVFYDPLDNFDLHSGWQTSCHWNVGIPAGPPIYTNGPRACVHDWCVGTNLDGASGGGYDWGNCSLQSPPITVRAPALTDYSNLYLSFWGWIGMSPGDCARVRYSIDNGITWHILEFDSPGRYDSSAGGSECFSGSRVWDNYYAPIQVPWVTPFEIAFRFEIYTQGGSSPSPGFYVDELRLVAMPN